MSMLAQLKIKKEIIKGIFPDDYIGFRDRGFSIYDIILDILNIIF